jgi:carbon-monoxide dehydrogenase large subunit
MSAAAGTGGGDGDAMSAAAGPGGGAVGRSVGRIEDRPLLTGAGCFVDDLALPGAAELAVLRSPQAHARIASIDLGPALALDGVVDAFAADALGDPAPEIPMRMFRIPGMERFLQTPLARDRVRYSGEPVAVVVAESRYVAEDALERIEVAYEPLEPVLDAEAALEPGAEPLFPAAGTNLAAAFTVGEGGEQAVFEQAALVVRERIRCQRHAAVPMEMRGLAAELDARTGELTVWGAAKVVHVNRRILAALLGWPEERIRLVELAVGGGFGARGEFYPEDFLVPFAAVRLGRPVRWTEDREENLRALNHSRDQLHEIEMALAEDGTFLALRDRVTFDTGAYVRTHGTVVPGMTAGLLPGPYRWGSYRCDVRHVVTNKTPAGTYRAPGRYEANLARERLIDIAAHRLGRDPVDLRRQNLVPPDAMPYATGSHTDGHPVVLDSGDFPLLLDRALERFDYERWRAWAAEDAGPAIRRGVGVGYFVEKSGIGQWDWARVALTSEGRAVVHTGTASVGQGVETVLAQICADALGIRYEDVEAVRHGDTAEVPDGMGAFGSRATMLGGSAVLNAGGALRRRILRHAGAVLEAAEQDLTIEDGRVVVRGSPGIGVSLADVAAAARPANALAHGVEPGLSEEAYFVAEAMGFPYGFHCAAVEVDVETGGVEVRHYTVTYDVGKAINPQLIEGQIVGGAAQGIGGALYEHLAYDAGGQLISGSFMDYLLPTAVESPAVDVLVTEDAPTPLNPLGAKGAGEGGTAAVGATIANAVSDALGVEVTELPLGPERVRRLAGESSPKRLL